MGDYLPFIDIGSNLKLRSIAPSNTRTCILLTTLQVKCWGAAWNSQLGYEDGFNRGDGSNELGDNLPFINLGTGVLTTILETGEYHNLIITPSGQVKAWGYGNQGQLGEGDSNNYGSSENEMGNYRPFVSLGTGLTAVDICGGDEFSCAQFDNFEMKCWGSSWAGKSSFTFKVSFILSYSRSKWLWRYRS